MIAVGPVGVARRERPVPFYEYHTLNIHGEERIFMARFWYWTIFLRWPPRFINRWLKMARYHLDAIKFRMKPVGLWLTGHQSKFYVNVYAVDRCYGGSEEGGWYYDVGIPFDGIPRNSYGCDTLEEAQLIQGWLEKTLVDYQPDRNRYSVIGGEDIIAAIEEHPAQTWPQIRPHYC